MAVKNAVIDRFARNDGVLTLGLPEVVLRDVVTSTQDVAHQRAADGAPAGTLVLARAQTAGRGRSGRRWSSEHDEGIWLTLIERPESHSALEVLSLRIGLRIAESLDDLARERLRLKWPNDLLLGNDKLGGILVEARWRSDRLDWMAIGVGINLAAPSLPSSEERQAASLPAGVDPFDVLRRIVPAIRSAAAEDAPLSEDELIRYAERDIARGKRSIAPVAGIVRGIDRAGALLIDSASGPVAARSGSLILER